MGHRYFPHTSADIAEMLKRCGMEGLEDLYSDVPDSLKLKRGYDLKPQMSEKEVRDFLKDWSLKTSL